MRGLIVLALAVGLTVTGAGVSAASASSFGSGPTDGGTVVELPAPTTPRFTQVSANVHHALALDADGVAWAWGGNSAGQLGDGTTTDRSTAAPVTMPAGVRFTAVSAGAFQSYALDSHGDAWAWGTNAAGQLGEGTTTDSSVPAPVTMPVGVTFSRIDAGSDHALAVGSDGKVYAWGDNSNGQLGDGSPGGSDVPVAVSLPGGSATEVSAGDSHSLALDHTGRAYAWGLNLDGELGDGSTTDSSVPVAVTMPVGVAFTSISAGFLHSLALTASGTAYAWGWNAAAQLGNGTFADAHAPTPVTMPVGVTFSALTAGGFHSLALGSDGRAYAWGDNSPGDYGNGTTVPSLVPAVTSLPGAPAVTGLSAATYYTAAVGTDGNAYAWGSNAFGQLGDGTTTSSPAPVRVRRPAVAVTSIGFGGVLGTGLVESSPGVWRVTTPPHAAGAVDIVIAWTLGGIAQPPMTIAAGFTYVATLAATGVDPFFVLLGAVLLVLVGVVLLSRLRGGRRH